MINLIPDRYYKSIFDINYDKLKKDNVKCLLFDLDNTIAPVNVKSVDDKYIELMSRLKNDFEIVLISNAMPGRTKLFANSLNIPYVSLACKPSSRNYLKVINKYGFLKSEVATIGDQLYTDIKGASKSGIMGILVDPISEVDSFFTRRNRKKEKKFLENNKQLRRGEYYE